MQCQRHIAVFASVLLLAGCSKEPPPRSVAEFIDNPLLLEAALVRCTQDRAKLRYEAECVNAREAVRIVEAREDAARRAELEAQSERKREALRRTQRAAAEARRRAEEAERRRQEEAYLAQFGPLPDDGSDAEEALSGNMPGAVIPAARPEDGYAAPSSAALPLPAAGSNAPLVEAAPESAAYSPDAETPLPAADSDVSPGDAAPQVEAVTAPPESEPETSDLQAVRDELRRRNEDGGN